METFIALKQLTENPYFEAQREKGLAALSDTAIDEPIIDIIRGFKKLPYCFTLQSCYGHFLYNGQDDPENLEPLPETDIISRVEYRIAYIALCIENSESGRGLFRELDEIPSVDPENIQFCCAQWFWKRQLNSYALQVEPDRFKHQDKAILDYHEALKIEKVRNEFFIEIKKLLQKHY